MRLECGSAPVRAAIPRSMMRQQWLASMISTLACTCKHLDDAPTVAREHDQHIGLHGQTRSRHWPARANMINTLACTGAQLAAWRTLMARAKRGH